MNELTPTAPDTLDEIVASHSIIRRWLLIAVFIVLHPPEGDAQDTINGVVWYPSVQLSDAAYDAVIPSIALGSENAVHLTWHAGGAPFRLPYRRSTDGGVTFEPTREMILDSSFTNFSANNPKIVAEQDKVYLLFTNNDPPNLTSKVRMFKSIDGGATFSPVQEISPHKAGFIDRATILGDTIAIVYPTPPDGRHLLYSTNGGSTWLQTSENLSGENDPVVALTPGHFHLTKHYDTGFTLETRYQRSSNLGYSWSVDTVLSEVDWNYSDIPTIAAHQTECGTEVQVLWRDTKYGAIGGFGASIIRRMSIDGGVHWTPEEVLTTIPDGSYPLAAISDQVHAITWWGETPIDTLHSIVRWSNHSQFTLSPPADLTPWAYTAGTLGLVVSNNSIHVTWEESVNDTWRIFYRRGVFLHTGAIFSLSESAVIFDTTIVDSPREDTITVFNSGVDTMVIGTAMTLDSINFDISPPVAVVPPGGTSPFIVTFHPQVDGTLSTKAVFYHSGQSSPDCIGITGDALWREETISTVPSEWNMISSPLAPGDHQTLPLLYSFENGSYKKEDSLEAGKGYWAKPADSLITVTGRGIARMDVPVAKGWNLIGMLTDPLPVAGVTTTPDSLLVSGFYGYTGEAYVLADTLQPGKSYWVKVKEAGVIELGSE